MGALMDGNRSPRGISRRPGTIANWTYRWTMCSWWLGLIAVSAASTIHDTKTARAFATQAAPYWIAALLLALRSLRLGVVFAGEELVIRSWFRTRRIPVSSVKRAKAVKYDGAKCPTKVLYMLRITRRESKSLDAYGIIGRPRKIERLVADFNALLDSVADPQHATGPSACPP